MRLQATHFVEVYRLSSGLINQTPVIPIEDLEYSLFGTRIAKLETIAIFKICPRNPITIIKEDQVQVDHTKIIKHE